MTTSRRWVPSVILSTSIAAIALGAWWWQIGVLRSHPMPINSEQWERVKDEFPLAEGGEEPPRLAAKAAESIIHANPFSPQRERAPVSNQGDGTPGVEGSPPVPKFVYKGGIKLGARQRAIVEDTNNHKTYFLEVGQEAAGFKVLDISENRVVLSDLQTREEVVVSLAPTAKP